MKRIIVIGCPGSGKSVFSRRLAEITGFPLIHLDMIYWKPDKTRLSREEFDDILHRESAGESWIMDGNYARTMEYRLRKCDGVIFMDYPTEVCLQGLRDRAGKNRPDMPWTSEQDDPEFVEYVSRFSKEQRPHILELLDRYSRKQIITLHSRREADELLDYWHRTYKKHS